MSILIPLALVASIALIVWLVRKATASARRLDEGIDEYQKEREAQGPVDPYAELSGLMANSQDRKRTPRK
ncbi:MAG: hypothetical protein Q7T82_17100 [Armatimonadota bacterium]|nr:hypothetical protein [Armatimonadota bacterium]